jgi:hypothetical protein
MKEINPNLRIRTPEGCCLSQATYFNHHKVSTFFTNLEHVLQKCPALAHGTRTFNLCETSTSIVPGKLQLSPHREIKQQRALVTTCCIISACGTFLSMAMIFPQAHFNQYMINVTPPATLELATKTSELSVEIMKHYTHCSDSSKDNSSLLSLDNYESHFSTEATDIAEDKEVPC